MIQRTRTTRPSLARFCVVWALAITGCALFWVAVVLLTQEIK